MPISKRKKKKKRYCTLSENHTNVNLKKFNQQLVAGGQPQILKMGHTNTLWKAVHQYRQKIHQMDSQFAGGLTTDTKL